MTYYKDIKISDNNEPIVLLSDNDFLLEPFYFNKGIAPSPEIKLREFVIGKLTRAKKLLPKGCNFKIFDGYRLLSTQTKLFDGLYNYYREHHSDWDDSLLREKTLMFVAFPSRDKDCPSPHNTGGAVDLTVTDDQGNDLNMGGPFDDFSERFSGFTDYFEYKNKRFHENRMLLKCVMEEVGFVNFKNEWWHYSYGDQMWAFQKGRNYAIYGSVELK